MYEKEKNLLGHYDSHLSYASSLDDIKLEEILEKLGTRILPGGSVLDLGCGDARLYGDLRKYRVTYTGVDYSEGRIKMAQTTYPDVALVCEDVWAYMSHSETLFDTIACFEVLEHLEEPSKLVGLALSKLSAGGVMIGSVPINMPYVAHLQVFETQEDVIERLQPQLCVPESGHFWCKWERAHI